MSPPRFRVFWFLVQSVERVDSGHPSARFQTLNSAKCCHTLAPYSDSLHRWKRTATSDRRRHYLYGAFEIRFHFFLLFFLSTKFCMSVSLCQFFLRLSRGWKEWLSVEHLGLMLLSCVSKPPPQIVHVIFCTLLSRLHGKEALTGGGFYRRLT